MMIIKQMILMKNESIHDSIHLKESMVFDMIRMV
jgi:hypothetical protein